MLSEEILFCAQIICQILPLKIKITTTFINANYLSSLDKVT